MREEIKKAVEIIRNGGVILYPTDTIWGLGCDPKNEDALAKLNKIKQRLDGKHYILLVDGEHRLYNYVKEIPEVCFDLTVHTEDPITIVYPGGKNVHESILAEDGSVAIRICEMKETKHLLQQLRHGLVSTSANLSGGNNPKDFNDIHEDIKKAVDFIFMPELKLKKSKPSSMIKVELDSQIKILRK